MTPQWLRADAPDAPEFTFRHPNTALLTNSRKQSETPLNMSRPGPSAPRNLTLTEELEKLEQSITLTLQGSSANNPETLARRAQH